MRQPPSDPIPMALRRLWSTLRMDGPLEQHRRPGIDITVLPALLARLDPATATDLRRQLGEDLVNLRRGLDAAVQPPVDTPAIARHAHVLIALAGTAGATTLAARARTLLDAASGPDAAVAPRLTPEVLPMIDALAAFVATCPVPRTRSRR